MFPFLFAIIVIAFYDVIKNELAFPMPIFISIHNQQRERVRESREDAEKRAAHNLINIFMLIGDSHSAQEVNTLTHTHMQLQAPFTVNLPTRGRAFINSNALKGQEKKRKHITALLMW